MLEKVSPWALGNTHRNAEWGAQGGMQRRVEGAWGDGDDANDGGEVLEELRAQPHVRGGREHHPNLQTRDRLI